MEQQLYVAVSSTSSWLDGVENNVLSGPALLPENAERHLQEQEVQLALLMQLQSQSFKITNHIRRTLFFCMNNSKPPHRH